MAVPRLRVPSAQYGGSLRQAAGLTSDEVELYHRTYTTLLRSSGETHLRVLEPSHAAMNSSLHPLANTSEPDLGAFMYAVRRLPAGIFKANPIVMGQEAVEFRRHGIGDLETWEAREAPARLPPPSAASTTRTLPGRRPQFAQTGKPSRGRFMGVSIESVTFQDLS